MTQEKEPLHYYIVPSEDAHQSEYVASSDKRRQYICGFSGTNGYAIISPTDAWLVTDSRYWGQALRQIDSNWRLVKAGGVNQPKDWIDWLISEAPPNSRIGIDARMISYEKATLLNSKLNPTGSKLVYPIQNLIDLVWKDKPSKSREPVFIQGREFAGEDAASKLDRLRQWIASQPPDVPKYSTSAPAQPKPNQIPIATLISNLPAIAYLLNLRGSDIPYNPLFHAYLFVSVDPAATTLFLDSSKVVPDVEAYLQNLGVQRKDYVDIWPFLRHRQWNNEGKIIISPQTSYTISLVLTHFRTMVLPSHAEHMMSIKNTTELEGMKRAYLRDGVAFTRFLAWLEAKLSDGYDITEWEAAHRLTEFRRTQKHFMGLAYENISASGKNAALPHYSPKKDDAKMIDRSQVYLNDSGGQYRDGTCDTTRTVHFGRPTEEECEAYTRVLQGHIAIDSAVFPEGTSGMQLDVLARRALWKEGMNYMHGTGHGFGSFLTVHEGPQGFNSAVPLTVGHVVTNEPGFYKEGKFGIRIESALAVKRFRGKGQSGDVWLGFERLTCVPIQTRMVKESMLTKEEKQWLKDHNQRCYDKLSSWLKDDKRAMKWLKREADRGIGLAGAAPGGLTVDWD
ncbi:Creatinase/aminopeptidase [Marasmius fiardii PR-910]|nr:Creatinase/aminopeptidase [Marasmius fiardii PR-910]